jgi:lipooligosaccharide transport system permease protein
MSASSSPPATVRVLAYHWLIYRRTWRGSIVIGVANPILFLTGIGIGIGALISSSGTSYLDVPYLTFLAPGLMAASAMQLGFGGGAFAVFNAVSRGGSYNAAVSTPTGSLDLLLGHQLFTAFRNLLFSTCFYLVALALGATASPLAVLTIPAAVLTGMAFSAPVAAWAVTVRRGATVQAVFRILIQPMYLLSGTFFPLTTAPEWIQKVAYISPLWHGVELCRALNTGRFEARDLLHTAVLVAITVAGLLCARATYARRLYR